MAGTRCYGPALSQLASAPPFSEEQVTVDSGEVDDTDWQIYVSADASTRGSGSLCHSVNQVRGG